MFASIGRFSIRLAVPIVAFWVVATVLSVQFLPSLASVSQSQLSAFLSVNSPSVQAAGLGNVFVPVRVASSVIVAANPGGRLTSLDLSVFNEVETKVKALPGVTAVVDQGISGDDGARIALVESTAGIFGSGVAAKALVDDIRHTFTQVNAPAGFQFHLTGELANQVDMNPFNVNSKQQKETEALSIVFIIVLLLMVFRSALAPLITLAPAALSLVLVGPIIAEVSKAGFQVSDFTEFMLIVIVLGAGTDYGLFLTFRVREEIARGYEPTEAIVYALIRVGESITFSASTVIAAFGTLLLASFGLYRGLGPDLAIAIAVVLVVDLTLLPALLAIFGKTVFWPSVPQAGHLREGLWGRIAGRAVSHPIPTLVSGAVLFVALALGAIDFSGGFGNPNLPASSDSAAGNAVLAAHFPAAEIDPTNVLFALPVPVWRFADVLVEGQQALARDPQFKAAAGPLDPNGTSITTSQLVTLHQALGPADKLSVIPPTGTRVSGQEYEAYRATAQFVSTNGYIVEYDTTLTAGAPGSDRAIDAIPSIRSAVSTLGQRIGAIRSGVAGEPAELYDLSHASEQDLVMLVPIVLMLIGLILAVLLRSLIAPLYLIATVALSYFAALGLVVLVFLIIGNESVIYFILPFVMFMFLMALGEDYNILIMSRIREEARHAPLSEAVRRALGRTGTTVTSSGLILAGTFIVLSVATSGLVRQIGIGVAAGILLDTFVVRTLLVPSIVIILGRWNWWPSHPPRDEEERASVGSDTVGSRLRK